MVVVDRRAGGDWLEMGKLLTGDVSRVVVLKLDGPSGHPRNMGASGR